MTDTKHTPTFVRPLPLRVRNSAAAYQIVDGIGERICSINTAITQQAEWADEIVRAVNAHDELAAALTNAMVSMARQGANSDLNNPLRAAWEDARAALAKAEGR